MAIVKVEVYEAHCDRCDKLLEVREDTSNWGSEWDAMSEALSHCWVYDPRDGAKLTCSECSVCEQCPTITDHSMNYLAFNERKQQVLCHNHTPREDR